MELKQVYFTSELTFSLLNWLLPTGSLGKWFWHPDILCMLRSFILLSYFLDGNWLHARWRYFFPFETLLIFTPSLTSLPPPVPISILPTGSWGPEAQIPASPWEPKQGWVLDSTRIRLLCAQWGELNNSLPTPLLWRKIQNSANVIIQSQWHDLKWNLFQSTALTEKMWIIIGPQFWTCTQTCPEKNFIRNMRATIGGAERGPTVIEKSERKVFTFM